MRKGFYYLTVAFITILCAIGGMKLIEIALPYSSENQIELLSTIGGVVILALGWVLGMLFEPNNY